MTGKADKRLFLLDAMALIYRAYHAFGAMRKSRGVGMVNSKGVETSAMLGFTNTLFDLIQRDEPTHIAVVFDTFGPRSGRRRMIFTRLTAMKHRRILSRPFPTSKRLFVVFGYLYWS